MIRTPDQRLRVFISSTIQEMAEERVVARKAIEELRLIPVLFEIGARPYPPRDVYQAYLAQSDVFIGIYWNSYGWIAPDMDISGLEDEYRLSIDKPKLIYLKKSDTRQERLKAMINALIAAGVSYKTFNDAQELKELIENDLALLLSEQFHKEPAVNEQDRSPVFNSIPNAYHTLVGREVEIGEIMSLIQVQHSRLVTVVGMGGTGKTRLAIELGHQLFSYFKHGVAFISLASINDLTRLPSALAHQLGLTDSSSQSVVETLLSFLSDKHTLLILDNFEQLTEGAILLSDILSRSKDVCILVTSRKPLYLRVEHIYPLNPLALPKEDCALTVQQAMEVPSVALFIQRAKSVNPRLQLNAENLNAICILCERLGGLPLTIELAAMRTRYLSPVALMKGMEKTLDILTDGARDLPDRQQSFRATIDWSYGLLSENEKSLFRIASIFEDGWTLEALSAVSNIPVNECMKITEQLLDAGLIRLKIDDNGAARYDMLQPIEEYAEELVALEGGKVDTEGRFLEYFVRQTLRVDSLQLSSVIHRDWMGIVTKEYENFRQAFTYAVKSDKKTDACRLIYSISIYWFREGFQNEGLRWIQEANVYPPEDWKLLDREQIRGMAMVMLISGTFKFFPADFNSGRADLLLGRSMFEFIGQLDGVARCNVYLGLTAISSGDHQGMHYFREATEAGKDSGDTFSVLISSTFIAEVFAVQGLFDQALESIHNAERLLEDYGNLKSYALELDDVAAIVYLEKGNIHFSMDDVEKAKAAYHKSLSHFEAAKAKSTKGYAVLSLGLIQMTERNLENARRYTFQALNESRETGDKIISLLSLRGLCALLLWGGKPDLSFKYIREVDAHLHTLKYSSWCVDIATLKYIKEEFAKYNIDYTNVSQEPMLAFDELIAELTKAMEE